MPHIYLLTTNRYSAALGGGGSFLNGANLVGAFDVVVDGRWAPYKQCNPKYGWDTREWYCENNCETPPLCNASSWQVGIIRVSSRRVRGGFQLIIENYIV